MLFRTRVLKGEFVSRIDLRFFPLFETAYYRLKLSSIPVRIQCFPIKSNFCLTDGSTLVVAFAFLSHNFG